MKPRRGGKRRFNAMQRRRRIAGDLDPGRDVGKKTGESTGFPRPIKKLPSRPWRRVDYFDGAWEQEDRARLLQHVARDLQLYRPGTRRLDSLSVALVTKDDIARSDGMAADELVLQYRLGKELAPLARRGDMTWKAVDQELDGFVNHTLPSIRRHVIPKIIGELHRGAGLDAKDGGAL